MKKTICLITDWYPTEENPYRGLFFKEQAFAVSEYFDFIVLHFKHPLFNIVGKRYKVKQINKEKNTIEYDVIVKTPICCYISDIIQDFVKKIITKNTIDGVGFYFSKYHKKYIEKTIQKIYLKYFYDSFDYLYCVDAQTEASTLESFSKISGKPYVVGEHAPVPWPGWVINDWNHSAIENANLFLAISKDKIRQLMTQNISLPKTSYIGNLIDESVYSLKKKEKKKEKTLIIIAANSHYKNYNMFISVMERLFDISSVPFKIIICGYGSNKGYSKNVKDFEDKIHSSVINDITELIPEVSHSSIVDVLHRADAFVMTSVQEGQPLSALEAACCGLPIFSTKCGGIEDYLNDNMGRLYNLNDIEGMAEGLKMFLTGELCFDSQIIRDNIISLYGKERFVKNFINAFNELL